MKTAFFAVPAALFAVSLAPCFAAEATLPKAETILDKAVESTGGKAAYQKLRNEIASGSLEVMGKGIKGTIKIYRAPGKTYTLSELPGVGKIEEGVNGDVVWSKNMMQGARLKEGEEKANSMRAARFDAEYNWREHYQKVETVGAEEVDGKPCFKVSVTPKDGAAQTRWYEKQSGLMVKVALIVKSPMGDIPAENYMADYKTSAGILTPRKITQKVMGQELVISIDQIDFNVELPPGIFDLPEDVKTLAAKSKAQ